MPSPKGVYTPKGGQFGGQSFRSYFAYQQARAQALGFSSYSEQRRITGISLVQNLIQRAVSTHTMSRNEATASVRQWWQDQDYHGRSAAPGRAHSDAQGLRKHNAIKWAMDNGLYDTGDDAADDIPY